MILIAIGVWAFSLTQNLHSVALWTTGFGILIAVVIASLFVLRSIRLGNQTDREQSVLRKVKKEYSKEKVDAKK